MNKWDLVESAARRDDASCARRPITGCRRSRACRWSRCPGLTGEGLDRLMQAVVDAHAVWNKRVPTAALNRWLDDVVVGASAARGVGPAPQAQLHDAAQGAAAELRAVLHAAPTRCRTPTGAIWSTSCARRSICPARRSGSPCARRTIPTRERRRGSADRSRMLRVRSRQFAWPCACCVAACELCTMIKLRSVR